MIKFRILPLFMISLLLLACQSGQTSSDENSGDDFPSFQYTVYSEYFELFAEADAFIAGHTSGIYAHFTTLDDFKPLESGAVTLLFKLNGKEYRQTLAQPSRKGIYVFEVTPEMAGSALMHFDIETEKGVFRMDVPVVSVFTSEEEARVAADAIFVSEVNTTVFTKEQSWLVDFATAFPVQESFSQVIKTTALVEAFPGSETTVSSNTSGFVQWGADLLLPGRKVSRGQSLMTISGKDMVDNNLAVRIAEARHNYERATADYQRVKSLATEKILSEKELLASRNQYENAKAVYEQISRNYSEQGQRVVSPQDGFIRQLFVAQGSYVEAGHPLMVISQHNRLIVTAEVSPRHAAALSLMTSANLRPLHQKEAYSLQQLNGKVLSMGRSANADNHLLPVSLQIDNNGRFIAGTFVEVFLQMGTRSGVLVLPNTALLEEQGSYFVWVQVNPELFEKRPVKTGATDGVRTEIVGGITPHERIVTRGAMMIKLAQATAGLDPHAGHVH